MDDSRPHRFTLNAEKKDETEIVLKRQFNAPKPLVFECFTDPALLVQWLGCGMGETIRCEVDTHIGGVWQHMMKLTNNQVFHTFGQTLEFDAPHRIVRSYVYNVPFIREYVSTETATFTDEPGSTLVTILIRHLNKQSRDGHFDSGLESGAGQSFNTLDGFLATRTS